MTIGGYKLNNPMSNSTQNDWEVRFNDRFLNNWGTLLDIKHFIRKELADARREVKTNIKEILSERKKMTVGAKVLRTFLRIKTLEKESLSMAYEDGFENALRQVLATLKEEES